MRNLDWTPKEFEAYLLLYAAHCNFFETEEEKNFILSKVDETTFHKMKKIVLEDTDAEKLKNIQRYMSLNKFSHQEKERLIRNIKNVFFADGSVDSNEKKVFHLLKKIID